jgi:hypothetical protein
LEHPVEHGVLNQEIDQRRVEFQVISVADSRRILDNLPLDRRLLREERIELGNFGEPERSICLPYQGTVQKMPRFHLQCVHDPRIARQEALQVVVLFAIVAVREKPGIEPDVSLQQWMMIEEPIQFPQEAMSPVRRFSWNGFVNRDERRRVDCQPKGQHKKRNSSEQRRGHRGKTSGVAPSGGRRRRLVCRQKSRDFGNQRLKSKWLVKVAVRLLLNFGSRATKISGDNQNGHSGIVRATETDQVPSIAIRHVQVCDQQRRGIKGHEGPRLIAAGSAAR